MRLLRAFSIISFTILLAAGGVSAALCQQSAETTPHIISSTPDVAVGSQYDTVHVYIAPQDFDGFVSNVLERWCGREDLNLHTLTAHAPQACGSANSAAAANIELVQTSSAYLKLMRLRIAEFSETGG